jgi:hypothetical protein
MTYALGTQAATTTLGDGLKQKLGMISKGYGMNKPRIEDKTL